MQQAPRRSFGKILLRTGLGLALVGGAGGAYAYRSRLKANSSCTAEEFNGAQAAAIEGFLEEGKQLGREDTRRCGSWGKRLVLYQYTTCPFCNKVRAVLDYNKVDYEVVEVDPLFKGEIKGTGYAKVPQLKICQHGQAEPESEQKNITLVDSEAMIDVLSPLLAENARNDDPKTAEWRAWSTNVLVRFLVLNTNRTLSESLQGYDYVEDSLDYSLWRKLVLKYIGSVTMFLVARYVTAAKLRKQFGYNPALNVDGMGPERTALMDEIQRWQEEGLSDSEAFHGGDEPDRADLEIYGILQSVRRLPVYGDIASKSGQRFRKWIVDMDELMPPSYASQYPILTVE